MSEQEVTLAMLFVMIRVIVFVSQKFFEEADREILASFVSEMTFSNSKPLSAKTHEGANR